MPQRWDLGAMGVPRGHFFFKHGHVAYQSDGDDGQNRMLVKFSSYGQAVDLGVRSKGQISCQFQRSLFQLLCVFSQIKDGNNFDQNFHSVVRVMPQGWDLGVLEGSKTSAWVFAMAPHRLRALVCFSIVAS